MNLNILIVLLKEINWNWLKKGIYLYEYMDNFKKFKKKIIYLVKNVFLIL